jgi:patatin-like phospholipase/acyl hydrolase
VGKCNILSIDGGGVRGSMPAELIRRLNKVEPHMLRNVDVFAGNSSGSFSAAVLAYGYTPEKLLQIYNEDTLKYLEQINPDPNGPPFLSDNLKEMLTSMFGNTRLSDLKKKIVIPTFYVGESGDCWHPIIYNNFRCSDNANTRLVDAVVSSSSAPAAYPSYGRNVDGDVLANDPSVLALSTIFKNICGISMNDVNLLAFGTGDYCNYVDGDTTKFSAYDWFVKNQGSPYYEMSVFAVTMATEYIADNFLGDNYLKLNPKLSEDIGFLDYTQVSKLFAYADRFDISNAISFINKKWLNGRCIV